MLKTLIKDIFDPVFAAISPNWIGRYGGLTEVLEYEATTGFDKKTGKKLKAQKERVPISCGVNAVECNNPTALYHDLVPDSTKASIVYWEQLTPMNFDGYRQGSGGLVYRNWRRYKGRARIVVWLNAAKLGIGEANNNYSCNWNQPFKDQLLQIISRYGRFTSGVYDGGLYNIEVVGEPIADVKQIFNKYTYNSLKNFFRYPYSFFALDVDFELTYCAGKNTSVELGVEIPCPFNQV